MKIALAQEQLLSRLKPKVHAPSKNNSNSNRRTLARGDIQKQIDKELSDPICQDLQVLLNHLKHRWEGIDEEYLGKVYSLLSLRLKQLGIEFGEDELYGLEDVLDIYYYVEIKSTLSFQRIARLSKARLVSALEIVRNNHTERLQYLSTF